jgi:hypothetical protein
MPIAPNTVHIMLDLETLSTQPNAAIIAIGAARLYSDDTFYKVIDCNSLKMYDPDAHIDPNTVLWWFGQSETARKEIYIGNESRPSLWSVLNDFLGWLSECSANNHKILIWGNGAAMDNVILRSAYNRRLGINTPWPYRNDRCYRTIKGLYPDLKLSHENDNAHNALEDAKYQARHLEYISDTSGLVLQ